MQAGTLAPGSGLWRLEAGSGVGARARPQGAIQAAELGATGIVQVVSDELDALLSKIQMHTTLR